MATIKQIEANRNNAKLSTGPVTTEGKAVSSRNALSSGIYAARESVLPHEDPRDLDNLTAEYYDRYAPATPEERCLVDSLVSDEWQLRRFRRIEGEMLTRSIQQPERHDPSISAAYSITERSLERLQRRVNATRKSYLKTLEALHHLRKLEAERQPAREQARRDCSTELSQVARCEQLPALHAGTADRSELVPREAQALRRPVAFGFVPSTSSFASPSRSAAAVFPLESRPNTRGEL